MKKSPPENPGAKPAGMPPLTLSVQKPTSPFMNVHHTSKAGALNRLKLQAARQLAAAGKMPARTADARPAEIHGLLTDVRLAAPLAEPLAEPLAAAPRKIVIQGFKERPRLPDDFEETAWARLRAAIDAVFAGRALGDSSEELYRLCESMCRHRFGSALYARVRARLEAFVQAARGELEALAAGGALLDALVRSWTLWSQRVIAVRSIVLYLDRSVTAPELPVWQLGQELFRDAVIGEGAVLRGPLVSAVASCALAASESNDLNQSGQIRLATSVFATLHAFTDAIEPALLDAYEAHYRADAQTHLLSNSPDNAAEALAKYLVHVDDRIESESRRCDLSWDAANHVALKLLHTTSPSPPGGGFLPLATRQPLVERMQNALVREHLDVLLGPAFSALLEKGKSFSHQLGLLLKFVTRVNAAETLQQRWTAYICEKGRALVTDPAHDASMIADLLEFHARLAAVLHGPFGGSEALATALRDAFEEFINQRPNRPAEQLARHLHSLLRQGRAAADGAQPLEAQLDACLVLFRFIHGKDVFEAFYKSHLAKRLLLQRSSSLDAERLMLAKLRHECGPAFTSKLEVMFKDVELARDLNTEFRRFRAAASPGAALDTTVNVLSAGIWPSYPTQGDVPLPPEMAAAQDQFRQFYLAKHAGRRLSWLNALGSCVVAARFPRAGAPPVEKELLVSLFQALVLRHFSAADTRLSFEELCAATRLDVGELRRTLLSLTHGRREARILVREPPAEAPLDECVFAVNPAFDSPLFRIRVNAVQLRESAAERQRTESRAVADRAYLVDAAIVRIMKARRSVKHSQLVSSVFEVLKLPLRQLDVKQRIESLIEREFLSRDSSDAEMYHYVA